MGQLRSLGLSDPVVSAETRHNPVSGTTSFKPKPELNRERQLTILEKSIKKARLLVPQFCILKSDS